MDNKQERFSLLLLEPNEIYFEDMAVTLLPEPPRFGTGKPASYSSSSSSIGGPQSPDDDRHIGLLKMCSKSLVYVPRDHSQPLLKLAYRHCTDISHVPQSLFEHGPRTAEVLAVRCHQHTELLAGGRLAPYEFRDGERLLRFRLHYARVEQHLQLLGQLRRAATLHATGQNDMIATIVFSRHNRLQFDPHWLSNFTEPFVCDSTVDEISPLVTNPGRLLLTTRCVYFQPYNNILPYPVKKLPLHTITSVTKRRFLLRHTGLEIHYTDPDPALRKPHHLLYVSFRSAAERTAFHEHLVRQPDLRLQHTPPETMTLRWQNGLVSNFDYLQHLNSLADRTAQDLTQYPIFPWVLTDYESAELDLRDAAVYRDLRRPMGALNAERLQRLRERCEEMGEPKFLYGSHYSAPGLVLFYLVRRHPQLMLCLQNGRYDHPDRMFNSVADAFANCMRNMSDFKELIPEFYDVDAGKHVGGFLLNSGKIAFGVQHTGEAVNHVQLPPWAHGSPERFVRTLREALESEHVSRNLHHWIDLIFGYKQRGEEALKADNLFYHLCYEGSVDLDRVPDLAARHAFEVQISEFGQIPKQLFDQPHVQRTCGSNGNAYGGSASRQASVDELPTPTADLPAVPKSSTATPSPPTVPVSAGRSITGLQLVATLNAHKDLICCVTTLADNAYGDATRIMSTGKDGLLKWCDLGAIALDADAAGADGSSAATAAAVRPSRSVAIGAQPLSACVRLGATNRIVLGSWDETIKTYNMNCGRITNEFVAHDDAVSCLSLAEMDVGGGPTAAAGAADFGLLVSGSWDCSVKVWSGFRADDMQQSFRASDALLTYLQLDDKIASLHAIVVLPDEDDNADDHHRSSVPQLRVLIGTFGGQVHLWTPPLANVTRLGGARFDKPSLPAGAAVGASVLLHRHADEVTIVRLGPAGRRAASCGLDGVLLVSDVRTGMRLMRAEHLAAWCCMAWPRELSAVGDVLLLGDDRGAVSVWNMRTGGRQTLVEGVFGGESGGGLVSALAACRRPGGGRRKRSEIVVGVGEEMRVPTHKGDGHDDRADGDDEDDVLLVVAAGVNYPRDFNVKVLRVV